MDLYMPIKLFDNAQNSWIWPRRSMGLKDVRRLAASKRVTERKVQKIAAMRDFLEKGEFGSCALTLETFIEEFGKTEEPVVIKFMRALASKDPSLKSIAPAAFAYLTHCSLSTPVGRGLIVSVANADKLAELERYIRETSTLSMMGKWKRFRHLNWYACRVLRDLND